MQGRLAFLGTVLLAACSAAPELGTQEQTSSGDDDHGDHDGGQWHQDEHGRHHHSGSANVVATQSKSSLLQTSDTAWTLTKTAAVDPTSKTVTWTIAATKGATTGGRLLVDGFLDVTNRGNGPATLGNIVVNLQAKVGHRWITVSSDVADATQGDAATSAHVVAEDTADPRHSVISENAASGALSFMDRRFNTMFSLVPEVQLQPNSTLPLLFAAAFDNNTLHLPMYADVRFEVIVTFGNHPVGGPHKTDENVDINGNGIIDADEHKVRSVDALFEQSVPAQTNANATLALSDKPSDITTVGDVTFSNAMINLGATTGTVSVSYVPGRHGGSITNCVHGKGSGITDPVGSYTFTAVAPLTLTTCTTAEIRQPTCTPGAPGCGWHDGDVISYDQNIWGADPSFGPPAKTLQDHFFDVYSSGLFEIGGRFVMDFDNPTSLLDYLPQSDPIGVLTGSLSDTTSSSSGVYGGQVAALKLNIDFADAGYTAGTATVKFGDLRLCGLTTTPGLNNQTIRQLGAVVNTELGGGSTPYSLVDLSNLLVQVNAAFQGGFASTFAQASILNATACP